VMVTSGHVHHLVEVGARTGPEVRSLRVRHRQQHTLPDVGWDAQHFGRLALVALVYDEVAELGADTLWADLQAALRRTVRAAACAGRVVSAVYDSGEAHYTQGSKKDHVRRTVEHPVVRIDPDTGRKGLFLSTGALRLVGVTEAESRALLPFLLTHASSPNYTIRYHWQAGDFVIRDRR
jgi:alpha-ketoglutarate-dependent taurine dioxygenase